MDVAQDGAGPGAVGLTAAQAEGLRAENRRLGLDLDDLRDENRRLRSATEQMRAEILALSRALEPMHRLNEELAAWRARSASSAADETAEERRVRDSQQVLQARAEQLAQLVRAIHASSSWRLTKPWRVLGRWLRGQRGGDWPAP